MWELKEHNNSGAIIRIWQNHFIVAGFLTFWHALDPFIGNKKDSYIVYDHDQCYSVSAPGDVWECEVRSKWCVLCWPHASTSAPDAQIWPGKFANPSKAKQSSLGSTSQAEPGGERGERPGHRGHWPDCGSQQRTLIGQLSCTRPLIGWYRSGPGCGDWEDHTKPHISASITLCPLVKHITISYIFLCYLISNTPILIILCMYLLES